MSENKQALPPLGDDLDGIIRRTSRGQAFVSEMVDAIEAYARTCIAADRAARALNDAEIVILLGGAGGTPVWTPEALAAARARADKWADWFLFNAPASVKAIDAASLQGSDAGDASGPKREVEGLPGTDLLPTLDAWSAAAGDDLVAGLLSRAAAEIRRLDAICAQGGDAADGSHTDATPQEPTLQLLQRAFAKGWSTCAGWARRGDLLADMDSRAYIAERDSSLSGLSADAGDEEIREPRQRARSIKFDLKITPEDHARGLALLDKARAGNRDVRAAVSHEASVGAAASNKAGMIYEFDDDERALIAKCQRSREHVEFGDPVKDVLDENELVDAMLLLLNIVDAEESGVRLR